MADENIWDDDEAPPDEAPQQSPQQSRIQALSGQFRKFNQIPTGLDERNTKIVNYQANRAIHGLASGLDARLKNAGTGAAAGIAKGRHGVFQSPKLGVNYTANFQPLRTRSEAAPQKEAAADGPKPITGSGGAGPFASPQMTSVGAGRPTGGALPAGRLSVFDNPARDLGPGNRPALNAGPKPASKFDYDYDPDEDKFL